MMEENKKKLETQSNQKKLIETKQKTFEEKKKNLEVKFSSENLENSDLITFAIRFPNGQRIEKEFDITKTIQDVYDFIFIQDDKGFENNTNEFQIKSAGFPPKVLDTTKMIKEEFHNSDQEALTVVEIFKDN